VVKMVSMETPVTFKRCMFFTRWSSSTATYTKTKRSWFWWFSGIERLLFYWNGTGSRK
jgi:hypothetical protein